ncbi:hypothetical protein Taro_056015, partial [Colocasia esculenta]|nr:hypothetical protein [Colocasia esculenta]
GQTREQPFPLLFLLFFSFSIFVRFHSFRWLTGARGKTLVREAELDRAENNESGGDSREKASRGSARIEVWQNFLHASELTAGALAVNLFSGGSRRRVLVVYFTLDVKLCYRLHPG